MVNDIYIRCDANPEIGLGHLYRCLALAEILKHDFTITFFIYSPNQNVFSIINQTGFILKSIQHENEFLENVRQNIIVAIDGYNFGSDYQQKIKEAKASLVFIDDLHEGFYHADVIINHAGGVNKKMYNTYSSTKLYLGIEYALLRSEFIEASQKERIGNHINKAFVCFGGSYQDDLILKTLNILCKLETIEEIHILLGPISDVTEREVGRVLKVSTYKNLSASRICELLTHCNIAIVPSSNISIEAYAIGIFMITGLTSDNQQDIYEGYRDNDFIYRLGDLKNISQRSLNEGFKHFQNLQKPFVFNRKKINRSAIINIFTNLRSSIS